MTSRTFQSLVLAIGLASTGVALASGSYGTGGGDQANQAYNLGKAVFYKKLICKTCPLAQGEPDAGKAAEIVKQLNEKPGGAGNISAAEREAAIQYLKRRYRLD
jgi:hypothetical protein